MSTALAHNGVGPRIVRWVVRSLTRLHARPAENGVPGCDPWGWPLHFEEFCQSH